MLNPEIINWLEEQSGQVENTQTLVGGITTSMYRITFTNGQQAVLRVYDHVGMLEESPDSCQKEASALQLVANSPVKAPRLIAYESDASRCGHPLLLMEALGGQVILQPEDRTSWLQQMANCLATIHAIPAPDYPWQFFRYCDAAKTSVPRWAKNPQHWQTALEILRSPEPASPRCFIHRDFHPTNLLWQNEQLSGVVDWVNACVGTAGLDIAHMRVNLTCLYGHAVADEFLLAYQAAQPDFRYHPYWDLVGIADFYLEGDDAPGVYTPWLALGMRGLSDELMLQRAEDYLLSVLARF